MARGWGRWPRYPASKPRDAADGIKARSQRGAIGETWWSRRFIEVLESFGMGARLTRGRSYARRGQVMDLRIGAGQVSARVQGSRKAPYLVSLEIDPFSEDEWAQVIARLGQQAVFAARLLAGEMPDEIEEPFAEAGLSLFPAGTRDLGTACSCPDWANPCKHVAATLYILAEQFDLDPWAILAWRGRSREDVLSALRALRGAGDTAVAATPTGQPLPLPACDGDVAAWFEGEPGSFDEARRAVSAVHAASAGPALLDVLGPTGISVAGRDLAEWLRPVFEED